MESRTTVKQRLAIVLGVLTGVHVLGSVGLTYVLSSDAHPASLSTLGWFLKGLPYAEYGAPYVLIYGMAAAATLLILSLCVIAGCLTIATGIWLATGKWIFNEA